MAAQPPATNLPATPPGFALPQEIGKLQTDDYTEMLRESLPAENVKYSGVWTLEKTFSKSMETMTAEEQNAFI